MFKFLKNIQKAKKINLQIEKYKAKSELLTAKTAFEIKKNEKTGKVLDSTGKALQHAEDLKQQVKETLQEDTIIQILNNPTVQQLIKAGAMKLMGGGSISTDDDELITLYKKLPVDIKSKVKDFALDYITQK